MSFGQPMRTSCGLVNCDIHPQVTFPKGFMCPVCQKTDSNIVEILHKLKFIEVRLATIERRLEAL